MLEKIKPISFKEVTTDAEAESNGTTSEASQQAENVNNPSKREHEDNLPSNQRKRRRFEGYKEDPFVFFNDDETVWPDIKLFYQISDEFDPKCLLTRCHGGKKKNIYLTSPAVRDLVLQNQHAVKFINTGIRTFVRSDNRNMKCAFR